MIFLAPGPKSRNTHNRMFQPSTTLRVNSMWTLSLVHCLSIILICLLFFLQYLFLSLLYSTLPLRTFTFHKIVLLLDTSVVLTVSSLSYFCLFPCFLLFPASSCSNLLVPAVGIGSWLFPNWSAQFVFTSHNHSLWIFLFVCFLHSSHWIPSIFFILSL
jgi:hypothetical protein